MHDIKLSEILRALVFNCTEMKTTTKRTSVSQVGECETKWIERGRATEAFMLRLRKKKLSSQILCSLPDIPSCVIFGKRQCPSASIS